MISHFQSPALWLRLVRLTSLVVPKEFRSEWRREWEAEIISRWLLLGKWGRLNAQSKLDLLKRVQGALRDAFYFQQKRTSLVFVTLNLLAAVLTAFGALQEFIVRGILPGQTQPLLLSIAGISVSILFMISGIAMWRESLNARWLVLSTGALSILLHVYGALPPHRNMGYLALLVGAGYGFLLLLGFEWNRRRTLVL